MAFWDESEPSLETQNLGIKDTHKKDPQFIEERPGGTWDEADNWLQEKCFRAQQVAVSWKEWQRSSPCHLAAGFSRANKPSMLAASYMWLSL